MSNVDTEDRFDNQLVGADAEREARRQGWRPLEEFTGDPAQ